MHFVFSSEVVLDRHVQAQREALGTQQGLLDRLGVKKTERRPLVFLIISKNVFDGFEIMVELMTSCEKAFEKEVDIAAIRFELFSSIEAAAKNPVLEIASFVYFPDDDLRDVSEYPELLKILPFL